MTDELERRACIFTRANGGKCFYSLTSSPLLKEWAHATMLEHIKREHPREYDTEMAKVLAQRERKCGECGTVFQDGACYCSMCGRVV